MSASTDEQIQTYVVEGMSCDHCKLAISEEVTRVAGVEFVDVDLASKVVQVRGPDVSEEAVLSAIDEAGYEGRRA